VIIFTLGKKLPWSTDREKFDAWAEGRTGVPFVDANMRELKVNHFIS
jgi:deoxyribodipyrimidine photo-lyase